MNQTVFALLSFEGPDEYSRAGGLGSRVSELSAEFAHMGFETHLFFVGSPSLPEEEDRVGGQLHLHRWCQWISRYHPAGVYDGEEGKAWDWDHSLPEWLADNLLAPSVAKGSHIVVMAEEWQTARSVNLLAGLVRARGWQQQVHLVWNANNTFSFDRIDWEQLRHSAAITTVSKYMKNELARRGLDAFVIPNGIDSGWLHSLPRVTGQIIAGMLSGRVTLAKAARWDPDKDWQGTMSAMAIMKEAGSRPFLVARGGREPYGAQVLADADRAGLRVDHVAWDKPGLASMLSAFHGARDADVIVIGNHLTEVERKALYSSVDCVLANSRIEPFGLVGLETMAVGGVAVVGSTGEDYATPGYDCIAVQTSHPAHLAHQIQTLKADALWSTRIRKAAKETAARYTWKSVIQRSLLPTLHLMGVPPVWTDPDRLPQSSSPGWRPALW